MSGKKPTPPSPGSPAWPSLNPGYTFRSPTYTPAPFEIRQEIWRFRLPLIWSPGKEIALTRICLEPDVSYAPLIGPKPPTSRDSRGNFVMRSDRQQSVGLELDALALMDACIHGQAQPETGKLPDLVGDLSARLVRLAGGNQERAGEAVGLIIDFIQSHAGMRGEALQAQFAISKGDTIKAWVEQPRGDTYVVLYGISKTEVR